MFLGVGVDCRRPLQRGFGRFRSLGLLLHVREALLQPLDGLCELADFVRAVLGIVVGLVLGRFQFRVQTRHLGLELPGALLGLAARVGGGCVQLLL